MEEFPQFPVPPKAFDGASRVVDAGACFDWLRQGWAMFIANPGVWIACAVLTLVIVFGLSIVPVVGHVAGNLLLPVLGAGLLYLCRRQADGATPEIADLFIGFKQQTGNLVVVGVVYTLAVLAIFFVTALLVGGGMAGGMMAGQVIGLGMMFGSMLLAFLLVLVLSIPIAMAMWFAPALVFFNAMPPVEAMKASFHACLKNWLAFLVYGVMLFVLIFFAALPLGLGFLVLIPVLAGALYASYRDVFVGV